MDPYASSQQDYWRYHNQVIVAEKLVISRDFKGALDTYERLFVDYDFVFLRDYKVATQLAFLTRDTLKAFDLLRKGVRAGWTLKGIKRNVFLSPLKASPQWKSFISAYAAERDAFLESLNHSLRLKVSEMFKADQRKALGAFLRIGGRLQERYTLNKFAPHSVKQVGILKDILQQWGYPGEQLIGNNFWMSTIISHHNSIGHNYVKEDTLYSISIRPILLKAIGQGQISPYEFSLIDDWHKSVISNRSAVGYGFLTHPTRHTLDSINTLRNSIGLRGIGLRNQLVEIEVETGIDFYLPDWVDGKIPISDI